MEAKETDSYSDDSGEKEEPKLKYSRLTNNVTSILSKDSASCLAAHPKFICLGTDWGSIYLLDHQGNTVRKPSNIRKHKVSVNKISIDERGDYIASCSDDGYVYVSGLHNSDSNYEKDFKRLVKAIGIDPCYESSQRFITGDEKLVLHEKGFMGRKVTEISYAEGSVSSISWCGQFVAWASDMGVRIYDVDNKCSLGLIKWPYNTDAPAKFFRCNFSWFDKHTLLIGWVDIVQVINLRNRTALEMANKDLPRIIAEPKYKFTTDFYICGIAPLYDDSDVLVNTSEINILVLGYCKDKSEDGKALRPTIQVIQAEPEDNDYKEITLPAELSLRGFENYKCTDYHLERVPHENLFFIVSPKDIVVASLLDADDRVAWLITHKRYEEALKAVEKAHNTTTLEVGRAYLDHLLEQEKYEEAAQLCPKILGKDKKLWEEEVYKFARIHQLRSISQYLPTGDTNTNSGVLSTVIYEMVLFEYLKMDQPGFLQLLKKWPAQVYDVPGVMNAVFEQAVTEGPENQILLESIAILYTHQHKYEKSLSVYLKLKHEDVFQLIHKHNLYSSIHDMVVGLMELDCDQAVNLLLDKNSVPPDVVVHKLQGNRYFLFRYLDALDKRDSARQYHGLLIELYADYSPGKLLPFLRRGDHYSIREALNTCQKRCLYPEMVYLLGRMGNTKEALQLITDQLKDIQQAIEFCKEQDDEELWENLITKSLDKPDFIKFLLQNIGTTIDPRLLVRRIAPGLEIPGLKGSLAKMMKDYGLQVTVQEGCKKILVCDYYNLQSRLINVQQRGINVNDEQTCGACNIRIIHRGNTNTNIVVFYCRHVFHEQCLTYVDRCLICHSRSNINK